jgi:hypothetical protein
MKGKAEEYDWTKDIGANKTVLMQLLLDLLSGEVAAGVSDPREFVQAAVDCDIRLTQDQLKALPAKDDELIMFYTTLLKSKDDAAERERNVVPLERERNVVASDPLQLPASLPGNKGKWLLQGNNYVFKGPGSDSKTSAGHNGRNMQSLFTVSTFGHYAAPSGTFSPSDERVETPQGTPKTPALGGFTPGGQFPYSAPSMGFGHGTGYGAPAIGAGTGAPAIGAGTGYAGNSPTLGGAGLTLGGAGLTDSQQRFDDSQRLDFDNSQRFDIFKRLERLESNLPGSNKRHKGSVTVTNAHVIAFITKVTCPTTGEFNPATVQQALQEFLDTQG